MGTYVHSVASDTIVNLTSLLGLVIIDNNMQ